MNRMETQRARAHGTQWSGRFSHLLLAMPLSALAGQLLGSIIAGIWLHSDSGRVWWHLFAQYALLDLIESTAIVAIPLALLLGYIAYSLGGKRPRLGLGTAFAVAATTVLLIVYRAISLMADT